jgi:hypothetical protein
MEPNIQGWNFGSTCVGTDSLPASFMLSYSVEICAAGDVPLCTAPAQGLRIVETDAVYSPSIFFTPGPEVL